MIGFWACFIVLFYVASISVDTSNQLKQSLVQIEEQQSTIEEQQSTIDSLNNALAEMATKNTKHLKLEVLRWSTTDPLTGNKYNFGIEIKNVDNFDWHEPSLVLNNYYKCSDIPRTVKSFESFKVNNIDCIDRGNNQMPDLSPNHVGMETEEGTYFSVMTWD